MLYIVRKDVQGTILARWDAWYIHCNEEAQEFIEANNLEVLEDEITFMGDRVIWVK